MAEPREPRDPKNPMRTRIDILWRGERRPSRGPRPKLTIDEIASAALRIADSDGIDAVSMQRVAAELGYTTMSLYRYVPAKEQLVEVMMDAAAGRPGHVEEELDWRGELEAWVRQLWQTYRRHPWVLQIPVSGPPVGPNQLAWFEAALRPLARAGLTGGDLVSATMFLLSAVRDFAQLDIALARGRSEAGMTTSESEAGFDAALREVIDPARFPTLAGLVDDGVFRPSGLDNSGIDLDLRFGLDRMLDGIESYVQARRH